MRPVVLIVAGFGILVAACGLQDSRESDGASAITADVQSATTSTFLDYKDAITRNLERLAREPRPVENSAMPPRHLNTELFPELLVDRFRIVSGGPPPDGIPSIDAPSFSPVTEVDWLEDDEAVILLDLDGRVRIYPIQILIWHEIVNDVVDGHPITVTYCPLCNSAIAFESQLDGQVLDFGVTGALYDSAMIMYDRQTESLWTHYDGRAVVGTLMGSELRRVPVSTVSWATASLNFHDALVLDRNSGFTKPYGRNRYIAYDQMESPLLGFFTGEVPDDLGEMDRIVGIWGPTGGTSVAVPLAQLRSQRVAQLEIRGSDVVVFWEPGTASALQRQNVADGDDIGASGVFSAQSGGRPLTFSFDGANIEDTETGSKWNILGHAVDGPLLGARLAPIEHLDTFWFSWVSYNPDSAVATSSNID